MIDAPNPASGYALPGDAAYQEQLYPNPREIDPAIGLKTYADVIAHFTASSLAQDGIPIDGSVVVTGDTSRGPYTVRFQPQPGFQAQAAQFARMHVSFLDRGCAGQALNGATACAATSAWNPMAGYPVNNSDGPSTWLLYPPLGMPMANHRAVTLLHYPPLAALRNADYLNNMTLRRWAQLLQCVGWLVGRRSTIRRRPAGFACATRISFRRSRFPVSRAAFRSLTSARRDLCGSTRPARN